MRICMGKRGDTVRSDDIRPIKYSEFKFKYFFAKEIPYGENGREVHIDGWIEFLGRLACAVAMFILYLLLVFDYVSSIGYFALGVAILCLICKPISYGTYRLAFAREKYYDSL